MFIIVCYYIKRNALVYQLFTKVSGIHITKNKYLTQILISTRSRLMENDEQGYSSKSSMRGSDTHFKRDKYHLLKKVEIKSL